jgi:tetratricopeptide (TPR) repeat protein
MAANSENSDRQIVPRWRPFREALATSELAAGTVAKAQAIDGTEFLQQREAAWSENRAMPFAVDLVGAATVLGATPTAQQAAVFILENASEASLVAQTLARRILKLGKEEPDASPLHSRIQIIHELKELKGKRIKQVRNAFVWVDLARLYVLLGQNEPARHALDVARKLAPNERFVLRSTARFLHHINENDEAVELLRNNSRTPSDAWLVAAEIAASSVIKKTPRFAKLGGELLNKADVLPFHTSELASALASFEIYEGNNRSANKLFKQSLRQPTDNALAQVVWASKKTGIGEVRTEVLERANASEALALNDFNHGNWEHAVSQAENWAQDEPFSARPLLLSSTAAASFLNEAKLAEEIVRRGLATNPGHPALVNNLAFALILQGSPLAALEEMTRVDKEAMTISDAVCLLATTGLAHFRIGNEIEGRRHYEAAIKFAKGPENDGLRTVATLYLARERIFRGDREGFGQFKKAYEAAQKLQGTYIPALAEHLTRDVELEAARLGVKTKIKKKETPRVEKDGVLL